MRKISYFLHFLLVITILTGICTALATEDSTAGTIASGTCGENLTWTLDENGLLTISGTGEMDSAPWTDYCEDIKTVVIDSGVTNIGDYAFSGCYNLTTITIPDMVTSIGDYTFFDCVDLTEIIVGENNNNFCSVDGVLFSKDLTTLICYPAGKTDQTYAIPDSVTSIVAYAFYRCSSLTDITIPDSVASIDGWAFSSCSGLKSITIPDSVTRINSGTFSYCTRLMIIAIPDSVTTIGDYAFYDCPRLATVYYAGTEEQWSAIKISYRNEPLTTASISFNADEIPGGLIASGTCGENLTWSLTDDGVLTITGEGEMDSAAKPSKPSSSTAA